MQKCRNAEMQKCRNVEMWKCIDANMHNCRNVCEVAAEMSHECSNVYMWVCRTVGLQRQGRVGMYEQYVRMLARTM